MDGGSEVGIEAGADPAGAVGGAILDRLDAIGRLLTQGAPPLPRTSEVEVHLVNRIDMLGRIVESLLADRDADEARLLALARRVVDLESALLPAVAACAERLDAALPILAGLASEGGPGAPALALVLRDLRDVVTRLDRAPVANGTTGRGGDRRSRSASVDVAGGARRSRPLAPGENRVAASGGFSGTSAADHAGLSDRPAGSASDDVGSRDGPEAALPPEPVDVPLVGATDSGSAGTPLSQGGPVAPQSGPWAADPPPPDRPTSSVPDPSRDQTEPSAEPLDEETERIRDALARALGAPT